ncbi:acyltransferase domain-containing protein, partial [Streptomyces mexicanus]
LQTGRHHHPYRHALITTTHTHAITHLRQPPTTTGAAPGRRPVVFMFPGGGAQYVGMGRGLYETEPVYREHLDACAEAALPHLGLDVRELLHAPAQDAEAARQQLTRTAPALAALFSVEYALARLWMSWGITPEAMIGHSLGEYVAACLAGVFTPADALALVVTRGHLIEELPEGAMLGVPLDEDEVVRRLGDRLDLAAVNGPGQCVVSGPAAEVDRFAAELAADGVDTGRRLRIRAAGHSRMLDPVLERFAAVVRGIRLNAPSIPYPSNVTGTWVTDAEATDPAYWVAHLRRTVRFGDGLRCLLDKGGDPVLLEVGPGRGLSALASLHTGAAGGSPYTRTSLRHPKDEVGDVEHLAGALADLWCRGVDVDWDAFGAPEGRRRVSLPGYPFEGRSYRIGVPAAPPAAPQPVGGPEPAATPALEANLSEAVHRRPELATPYVAPRDELEEMVTGVWQRLLGYDRVGVDDNFYSLGGHSLAATRVVSELRGAFDVQLPLERILQAVTPAEQAAVVRSLLLEKLETMTDEEAAGLLDEGRRR